MKLLPVSVAISGLLMIAAPAAFAVPAAPPDVVALDLAPVVVPDAGVTACPMMIVENVAACEFGILADRSCAPETLAALGVVGPRLLASSTFLAACLAPVGTPPPPA